MAIAIHGILQLVKPETRFSVDFLLNRTAATYNRHNVCPLESVARLP
jgi:hypothetical protein